MSELKKPGQNENEIKNYKVYVHINKLNNKKYVGITKQEHKRRWKGGWGYYPSERGRITYFWYAIQKYGWDGFEHSILEQYLTFTDAKERERYYISLYQSNKSEYGYNLTLGGDGFLGMPRSKSTREELSKSLKGKYVKEKSYWYGKHLTQETIEKQKETKRNNPYRHTAEWKIKHSEQLKGENNVSSRPVRCKNTGEIFVNAREAAEFYHTDNSRIHKCCKGLAESSGKQPITKEKLLWEYVDDDCSHLRSLTLKTGYDKANPRTEIEVIY